ncbi:hypothetical protein [Azospirillum sp. sgz301742]
MFEARFVDGLSDREVRALFDKARDADYEALAVDAGGWRRRLPRSRRCGARAAAKCEPK